MQRGVSMTQGKTLALSISMNLRPRVLSSRPQTLNPSSNSRVHRFGRNPQGLIRCEKPSLEIIPSNGNVQKDQLESFLCKVRTGGEAELTWYDPQGEEISEDSEPYREESVDELSKWLKITLSEPEAGGIFQCKGDFDGQIATTQIRIRVIQKPTFVSMPDTEKEVIEGETVNFSCSAIGIPQPRLRWLYKNQDLGLLKDGRISVENGCLVIENTQPSDAGVYACAASVEERKEVAFVNVTLSVKFSPRIELVTGTSLVTPIGNATKYNFTILANPSPSVSVSWKGQVFEGDDINLVVQDQDRYVFSFEFTPASKGDISDAVITATNEQGRKTKTLTLVAETPEKGLGPGSILGIMLLILLVVLLVVDMTCYYKRRRGLLMFCQSCVLRNKSTGASAENNGLSKSSRSTAGNVSSTEA